MLPKVATHILHTTTRAAATLQHQSHTIRNVFQPSSSTGQLAPWNSPGSSHWGNNGTGPGGAKYNTGSRFYNPYTGAGRAVTQANSTISSNDGSFSQNDDQDEFPVLRPGRLRIRSHSLSIPKQSVLKTVQLHAKSRQPFSPQVSPFPTVLPAPEQRPVLVRRNSTTSTSLSTEPFDPSIPAPSPPLSPRASPIHLIDPASPQTTVPPTIPLSDDVLLFNHLRDSGDHIRVAEAVHTFRQNTKTPSVREFNAALQALQATSRPGEPITLLLETYNDMLRHSLLPNMYTYATLIDALTRRDFEVNRAIHTVEAKIKHAKLTGTTEFHTANAKQLEILHAENNFASAMSIFESLLTINGTDALTTYSYTNLLRSCAIHGKIESAIHIFAQMEKRADDLKPTPTVYEYMIQCYTNAGQLSGAEQVFAEYRRALKRQTLHMAPRSNYDTTVNRANLFVFNQMIETYFRFNLPDKAIDLVDQMMRTEATSASLFADPPPVSSSTFTTVLSGFCQTGDVSTALVWFDRLLEQAPSTQEPFEPMGVPMQPDNVAWGIMLDALAVQGMVDDLNRLYTIRLEDPKSQARKLEAQVVYAANMASLPGMSDERAAKTLDFLRGAVCKFYTFVVTERIQMSSEILNAYLDRKMYDSAVDTLASIIKVWHDLVTRSSARDMTVSPALSTSIQSMQLNFAKKMYDATQGNIPYSIVLHLARFADQLRVKQQVEHIPFFVQSYAISRNAGTLPVQDMKLRDWELVLYAAIEIQETAQQGHPIPNHVPDYVFKGVASILEDMVTHQVGFNDLNENLRRRAVQSAALERGIQQTQDLFRDLGVVYGEPAAEEELDSDGSQDSGYISGQHYPNRQVRIDLNTNKALYNQLSAMHNPGFSAMHAFSTFRRAFENGKSPFPRTIGSLIQALGRAGRIEEMHYTYTAAQKSLEILSRNNEQKASWFQIEDSMVIGLAHHGDITTAHHHRHRILEQGGAPSADAYGALIYNVRDTTDDTSNAMSLFVESQKQGVKPNQYLYNNIISKLAKARKADYVLELFQAMKASDCKPSSVTYGAVIGACARVGDVQSAEMLFTEMVESPNFRPRIPPYNTMIQMYTTTKPDRDRALYFYSQLEKAKIEPTAHTYKLLLDTYGSIEPIDIESMERTFELLRADRTIKLQTTHFASLINAYGCVKKDITKAIEVFNSMVKYSVEPDALVYEALVSACVAHRRTDIMQEYLEKMVTAGVRMTAYIANVVIKGYAMAGDVERARQTFEALEDPPEGVAAPNNHAPHEPSSSPVLSTSEPVYREPSTWEAMIRAELGSGNRQGALDLLERLKARQYPDAVYYRISGILVDHTQIL